MLSYEDVLAITKSNEHFKLKHQNFGDTTVAQCTYFLAKAGDFFPEFIEIEENGEKFSIYGECLINNKKAKDYKDEELINLGFEYLSQFNFNS